MTTKSRESSLDAALLPAAVALALFLVAATLPYLWLVKHFGYDDILREPATVVLAGVARGGSPLVLAWLAFAMSALLFIPVAATLSPLGEGGAVGRTALILGIGSAILQAIGLLRWVLVVPSLAATFADPQSTAGTREAVLAVFDAVHRFGGTVVGEMVGQLLLAGWTGLTAHQLWRTRAVPRWLAATGALTVPFWLLGQAELLHAVAPAVPGIEVIPAAFIAWELWLAALGMALVVRARRAGRLPAPGTAAP